MNFKCGCDYVCVGCYSFKNLVKLTIFKMSSNKDSANVDGEAQRSNLSQKEDYSTLIKENSSNNSEPCSNDSNFSEPISAETCLEINCMNQIPSNDNSCRDNLTLNMSADEVEIQNTGDKIGASEEVKSVEQSFHQNIIVEENGGDNIGASEEDKSVEQSFHQMVISKENAGDNVGASEEAKIVEQSFRQMVIGKETSVITQSECSLNKGDKSPELQKPNADDLVISSKQIYKLKWIEWHNKKIPIVTQNENGPCPLIAIANILLLRGKIHLRNSMEKIESGELMDFIGDAIMESIPKDLKGPSMLNYEQNMHDAIAILPQLHTGLDVNIKFTGVQHFEYTPECIIFDLLNIPLYHGWLVDPQCQETVDALGNCGYNQLVEKIILNKCSPNPDNVTEALIAEQFLERTASQLTYHGLCELNSAMKPDELAVLFRNNHFSTILKRKSELFQLVTDQGFLHESRVVWETLCNIEGDGQFVDAQFATVPPKSADGFIPDPVLTEEQQINQDYLVALSLQEEQKKQQDREQAWQEYRDTLCNSSDLSDNFQEYGIHYKN